MDVFFWQNMPSHHQAGAIRFLAEHWRGEVHGVYERQMRPERRQLGWQIPDMGKTALHFLEQQDDPSAFIKTTIKGNAGAIHLFGGLRGAPAVETAFVQARKLRLPHLGVIAEYVDLRGWKGLARQVGYRLLSQKQRRIIKAALVMGEIGVECYLCLGYLPESLFPYMYQCDLPAQHIEPTSVGDVVKLLFIGRFVPTKGGDVLLDALSGLKGMNWHLTMVGGEDGSALGNMVRKLGLASQITIHGICASDQVIPLMRQHDICIVPSRYDGWGMATNEAIYAGIGTVVSDRAGSQDLVRFSGAGRIVPSENIGVLRSAIQQLIVQPEIINKWKQCAVQFAPRITGEVVGQYLAEVLSHVFVNDKKDNRPTPPWLI